eukprot:1161872-Pelagomonas_calceolata.AAC.4
MMQQTAMLFPPPAGVIVQETGESLGCLGRATGISVLNQLPARAQAAWQGFQPIDTSYLSHPCSGVIVPTYLHTYIVPTY